eukprot:m.194623 g.194623  ORF g.194623 m.194623 type:complete len:622 (+) comp32537_c0_seq2:2-1867(+)
MMMMMMLPMPLMLPLLSLVWVGAVGGQGILLLFLGLCSFYAHLGRHRQHQYHGHDLDHDHDRDHARESGDVASSSLIRVQDAERTIAMMKQRLATLAHQNETLAAELNTAHLDQRKRPPITPTVQTSTAGLPTPSLTKRMTMTTATTQTSGVHTMSLARWDEVTQQILAQQADLNKANIIINNLEAKVAGAEKGMQQLKLSSAKTIKELRTKCSRLEVGVSESKTKLDGLTSQSNIDAETNKALQDRVKVLELRRRSDTTSITMLKSQLSDKDTYLEQIKKTDDEIERLRSDLKKSRTQLHAKTMQLQQSKVAHDELKTNNETLKQSTSKAHKDTLTLQKTRSDLLNNRLVLRDAEATNTTLRAENTRHLEHIAALNSKITALEKEKLRWTALEKENVRQTTLKTDTEALKKQHTDARARNQHARAGMNLDYDHGNYTDDDNSNDSHRHNPHNHRNGQRHRHHNQSVEFDHHDRHDHRDHHDHQGQQHHKRRQDHVTNDQHHRNQHHGQITPDHHHRHNQRHDHITHNQHRGVVGDHGHDHDLHSQHHTNFADDFMHTNPHERLDFARDFDPDTSSGHAIAFDTSSQISTTRTNATDTVLEEVQDILNLTDVELQDLLNQD